MSKCTGWTIYRPNPPTVLSMSTPQGPHEQIQDISRTLDALRVNFQCMDVKLVEFGSRLGTVDASYTCVNERLGTIDGNITCVREEISSIRQDVHAIKQKLDALLKRANELSIWD